MTADELIKLRNLASECKLESRTLLYHDTGLVLRVCNGIGPSWFPSSLRAMIDAFHPSLKVVAAIHDLRYYFGTGEISDFHLANDEFNSNGFLVSRHLFGWYNPRRYIVEYDAAKFAKLCNLGGKVAYFAAIEERRLNDEAAISIARIDDLVNNGGI